jgi:hypothetical protein
MHDLIIDFFIVGTNAILWIAVDVFRARKRLRGVPNHPWLFFAAFALDPLMVAGAISAALVVSSNIGYLVLLAVTASAFYFTDTVTTRARSALKDVP